MTYANIYSPATDFSASQTLDHDALDAEFDNIKATLDELNANLRKLQRSDDQLANAAVHRDAITSEVLTLFRTGSWVWRSTWSTTETYKEKDLVHETTSNRLWVCIKDQTPAALFPGIANWVDVTSGPVGAVGPKGDPFGANGIVKTSDYTIVAADLDKTFFVSATGGLRTVTLPDATAVGAPWHVIVSKSDNTVNLVTVNTFGGQTINGNPSLSLTSQNDFAVFTSFGTADWQAFGSKGSSGITLPLPITQGGTGASSQAAARTALGLGSSAVINAGTGPGEVVLRDGLGNVAGVGAPPTYPISVALGGTGATSAPAARAALALGTAALVNTGNAIGNVPILPAAGTLPALSGALLTNLPVQAAFKRWGYAAASTLAATLLANEVMIAFGRCEVGTTTQSLNLRWNGVTQASMGGNTRETRVCMAAIGAPAGSFNLDLQAPAVNDPFLFYVVISA